MFKEPKAWLWRSWAVIVLLLLSSGAPIGAMETSVAGHPVGVDLTSSVREAFETSRSATHERTLEQLRIGTDVEVADWLRFHSATLAINGGPTMKANESGVFNWSDVFQDRSPAVDFEEFYFDFRLESFDAQVGKQRIAWGKLDRFSPLDVVNSLSYTDPFLIEEAERRLGAPSVNLSYSLPREVDLPEESRISALWIPAAVPYRFSDASCEVQSGVSQCNVERWFPPAAVPPSTFRIPAGAFSLPGGSQSPALAVPLGFSTHNASPGVRLENGSLGLRYTGLVGGADTGLYYFHGFDSQPAFSLSATAFGEPDRNPGNPIFVKDLRATTTLSPVFRHVNLGGADCAYSFDRFTFRAEAAYVNGRPFAKDMRGLITNPAALVPEIAAAIAALAQGKGQAQVPLPDSYAVRDAVEWGVAADYLVEGWLLMLQLNQTDVLRNSTTLLIHDTETRLLGTVKKSLWGDRILLQGLAGHSIQSDYSYLRPRLGYRLTDHLTVEAGYLFIAGRQSSVIGQYKHNNEGWLRLEVRI